MTLGAVIWHLRRGHLASAAQSGCAASLVPVIGAVLTSLAFVSLFTLTKSSSPTISAALTCFLFFLASTAFSMFSVPHLAGVFCLGACLGPMLFGKAYDAWGGYDAALMLSAAVLLAVVVLIATLGAYRTQKLD